MDLFAAVLARAALASLALSFADADACLGHRCDEAACPCGCECGTFNDPGLCYVPNHEFAQQAEITPVPSKMRAWYLNNYTVPSGMLFTGTYPVPQPKHGEVLIRVKAASVNPIDYKVLSPALHAAFPLHFPTVLGFESAGIVEMLGPCTSGRLKVGDEVWSDLGIKYIGGYAEFVAVDEKLVGLKPTSLSFEEAGTLPLVGMTALQGFEKANAIHPIKGKTVLVLGGSGGVGFVCVQLAKHYYGATKVITTTSAENVDFVKRIGADEVIDYHAANWWDVVPNGTVDFVYDTVGQSGTGPRATHKLKTLDYGVFLTIAHKGAIVGMDPNPPPNTVQLYLKQQYIPGSLDLLKSIVDRGILKPHVQQVYLLEDVPTAWDVSRAGHVVGKLAIKIEQSQAMLTV